MKRRLLGWLWLMVLPFAVRTGLGGVRPGSGTRRDESEVQGRGQRFCVGVSSFCRGRIPSRAVKGQGRERRGKVTERRWRLEASGMEHPATGAGDDALRR